MAGQFRLSMTGNGSDRRRVDIFVGVRDKRGLDNSKERGL
jgi:methylmalonyl-CoA mutase N-terminal domain/subunit